MANNSSSTFSNFLWRFLERWGAQGVTFVVSIVLARLLDPAVYGLVGIVTVLIALVQVFVDSGLGTALIQKKDVDDLDYSTVFWFNLCMCVVLYAIMFFSAPAIARFYSMPELVSLIRVLSLVLIISGVKHIQQAYVARNMMFKKFFFATLGGTIGAAAIGIVMAFLGFGVWALVAQYLFNSLVDTLILWLTVKWRPHFKYSFKRFKTLFSYGWKILISSLIDSVYSEIRTLIIGKYYSKNDLAYYSKGGQFPEHFVRNINTAMNSVLLPVLSKKQDDIEAVRSATRKTIQTSSYLIWPLMIGLCAVADKFVLVLLTEKWMPAVFFLRVLCFVSVFEPLQTTNLSVIKALGRAGLHLKIEIIKKSIATAIVILSALHSVQAIAFGSVLYAVIASILNAHPNKKLIRYGYFDQIRDLMPFILMSLAMGAAVFAIGLINIPNLLCLILQAVVGITVYVLLSVVFKIEAFHYFLGVVKRLLRSLRRKKKMQAR